MNGIRMGTVVDRCRYSDIGTIQNGVRINTAGTTMRNIMRRVAPAAERRLRPELQVARMPAHCSLLLIHSRADPWTPVRWRRYERIYLKEMAAPAARHLITLLATMSHSTDFSVGCYCEDASHCHRRLLARLLDDAGAKIVERMDE